MRSYFQLFDLPQCYQLDLERLDRNYRNLQASVHPDRFVGDGAQARRLAEQYSGLLNQAYTTLKSPVERAAHLLQLLGVEIDGAATISDGDFLFRQMTLRETLHDVRQQRDETALLQLRQQALAEQNGAAAGLFAGHQGSAKFAIRLAILAQDAVFSKVSG
jgi:molecular chaperone HscB